MYESVHLCGSSGSPTLRNGFAELKTRELALKYNLKISGRGYAKEVKIAFELQTIFGKGLGDIIAFTRNNNETISLLEYKYSYEASLFYRNVEKEMQSNSKLYYSKNYSELMGSMVKAKEYYKINYNHIYYLINSCQTIKKYIHKK